MVTLTNNICKQTFTAFFVNREEEISDYCGNEFLDESCIPIELEEEIIAVTEHNPVENNVRKSTAPRAPPPKKLNAHRPMNFEHAMKIFKVMQKRKAQASAREKHKGKKEKLKTLKPESQSIPKKYEESKSTSSKSIKSSKKKKRKSKKTTKHSSKINNTSKIEEEIEIDIIDV